MPHRYNINEKADLTRLVSLKPQIPIVHIILATSKVQHCAIPVYLFAKKFVTVVTIRFPSPWHVNAVCTYARHPNIRVKLTALPIVAKVPRLVNFDDNQEVHLIPPIVSKPLVTL